MTDRAPRGYGSKQIGAGIVGCLMIFLGILLMHDQDPFTMDPGLSTGILGDIFPHAQWILAGTLVSMLGGAIVLFCLPPYGGPDGFPFSSDKAADEIQSIEPRLTGPAQSTFRRITRLLGPAAILLGAICYAYVLMRAVHPEPVRSVLVCLAAAMGLFAFAIYRLLPGPPLRLTRRRLTRLDWGIIVAITAGFILLNTHDLTAWFYAFIGDEWSFYAAAKNIAGGYPVDVLSQSGVYGYHPLLDSLYQAGVMHFFGTTVFGWRLSSTLAPALPIAALYWGAKNWGGSIYAAVTCLVYAACSLLWAYAHIGYNNNDPLLVIIPAFAFFSVGLRYDWPLPLFAAGVMAGFGWYTFFTGRLMIGVLLLVLAMEWRGGWKSVLQRFALLSAGFVVAVLPFALDNGADTIKQMFLQTALSRSNADQGHALLLQNAVRGAYSFIIATENDHYVVGELFDALSATGLLIGIAVALRTIGFLHSRLLLAWYAGMLALVTPFFFAPQVPNTRLQVVAPAAALLSAFGWCSLARALQWLILQRERGVVLYTVLGVILAAIVYLNGRRFYVAMPRAEPPTLTAMMIGAIKAVPPSEMLLSGDIANYNVCVVLDGYGIDPAAAVMLGKAGLQPQCPDYIPHGIHQEPEVLVLVSGLTRQAIPSCAPRLRLLAEAPQTTQTVWGYRFALPLGPRATYEARLVRAVFSWCPTLPVSTP